MIATLLGDELKLRLSALAFAETIGASGDPLINIGAGTTRTASATIRIIVFGAPLAKDILGNASQVYATHIVQIATEANFAGTTDNIADNLTRQQLIDVLGPCLAVGAQVQWWEEADGTGPSETTFNTGAKLKATYNPNPYFVLGAQ